jgi:NAD+ synthase (glutamine-hydrolysing)
MGKIPETDRELMENIMFSAYMGTKNSSEETKVRAANMAAEIGSTHFENNIDDLFKTVTSTFTGIVGCEPPKYESQGGTPAEDLALQNMQARSRMVLSYTLSSLMMWRFNREGWLLVLGSSNLDEGLRGYCTKYDCSSADLNPLGCICKNDLKAMLKWLAENNGYPSLHEVIAARSTAELRPLGSANEVV